MADKHKNHKGGKGNDKPSTVKSLIRELLGSKVAGPLTGKNLRKEIRAGAKLRYGPLENELDAQLRAAKATQKRNKAYYNDYLKRVRNIQGQTGDIYDDANEQLATAQQQASAGDTGLLAILNQNRQNQAQLMGASPSSAINPLAQAQVQRSSLALGNQQRIIGQGATQQAYLGDQRRIGAAQKKQTLIEGQDRARSIHQQMEDLAREKGAFKTDMLRDLREGERGFLVDLLSGPNARKLAHIQMSGSNSGGSSSGSHEKANKGKNRREHHKNMNQAWSALQNRDPKPGASVSALATFLEDKGFDPGLARRVAKRWARRHKGGGHKGGHGGKGGKNGGTRGGHVIE